jgi:hypothetical protein
MAPLRLFCVFATFSMFAMVLRAQTLLSWAEKPPLHDTVTVRTFANGNIRGIATGSDTSVSTANGSVGVSMEWSRVTLAGVINVATSAKRLTADFGQSLLSPASGTGFKSGVLEVRFANYLHSFLGPLGLHIYASASSSTWRSNVDTTHSSNAAVTGLGVLLYRQVAAAQGDNKVSFGLEAGGSIRHLSGDIVEDKPLRTELLGSAARTFGGLEGGMTIAVNKVTAAVQLYYYWPRKVAGVSRVQITTGVSLQADLFSFKSSPEDR